MDIEISLKKINDKEVPAVTSQQVAEAFGKEHRNVLADIRNTISKCSESFNALNFQLVKYTDTKGEERPMYLLSKDGLMMVTMGYTTSEAMRIKEAYINRFNEMEFTLAMSRPALSREEILSQALEIIGNENSALKQQLALDAPKVEFADAVSEAEGGMTVNQFAKVLRQHGIKAMGSHRLFSELRKHGFLMRQRKHWNVPKQRYIEKGWFRITVYTSTDDDCIQYEVTDFIITGQGQLRLMAFFMDKYGINRQLSLLDSKRRDRAHIVPMRRRGLSNDRPPHRQARHCGHAGDFPRCGRFHFGGMTMTDAERIKELVRLQAELNQVEAEAAEKVQAIKAQINELCGISTKATRKKSRMTSSQWVSAGRAITGGRRECVA